MARVSHGNGLPLIGHSVACQDLEPLRRRKFCWIDVEMPGEFAVQPDQARRSNGGRTKPRVKLLRKASVAVVEGKGLARLGLSHYDGLAHCLARRRLLTLGDSRLSTST